MDHACNRVDKSRGGFNAYGAWGREHPAWNATAHICPRCNLVGTGTTGLNGSLSPGWYCNWCRTNLPMWETRRWLIEKADMEVWATAGIVGSYDRRMRRERGQWRDTVA